MNPDARKGFDLALERARRCGSVRYDRLVRSRPIVLPASFARRLPLFGGAVLLSFIVVDPRVLYAPQSVLDYLAAHEWGHVERGDVALTYLALIAYAGLDVAYSDRPGTLAALVMALCVAVLGWFLWRMLSSRREHDADAFAARVVGAEAAAAALDWLVDWRGEGWSTELRARSAALRRL